MWSRIRSIFAKKQKNITPLDDYEQKIKETFGKQKKVKYSQLKIDEYETYYPLNTDKMPFESEIGKHKGNIPTMLKAAFSKHFGLIITPDLFHRCLLFTWASYLNACAEDIREWFVTHKNVKELEIFLQPMEMEILKHQQGKITPNTELFAVFEKILLNFNKQILSDTKNTKLIECLHSDYSTTTPIEAMYNKIEVLESNNKYYKCKINSICGLPFVVVRGTFEDWQNIIKKVEYLMETILEVANKFNTEPCNGPSPREILESGKFEKLGHEKSCSKKEMELEQLLAPIETEALEKARLWLYNSYGITDLHNCSEEIINQYRIKVNEITRASYQELDKPYVKLLEEFAEKREKYKYTRKMYMYLWEFREILFNVRKTRQGEDTKDFWNTIYSRSYGCGIESSEIGWLFNLLIKFSNKDYVRIKDGEEILDFPMCVNYSMDLAGNRMSLHAGIEEFTTVAVGNAYAFQPMIEISYQIS